MVEDITRFASGLAGFGEGGGLVGTLCLEDGNGSCLENKIVVVCWRS